MNVPQHLYKIRGIRLRPGLRVWLEGLAWKQGGQAWGSRDLADLNVTGLQDYEERDAGQKRYGGVSEKWF